MKEKKELSLEVEALRADATRISQAKLSGLKNEISQLQTDNRKLNAALKSKSSEFEKIRAILHKVKPADLKKYKQKATSLDQLYHSMKAKRHGRC